MNQILQNDIASIRIMMPYIVYGIIITAIVIGVEIIIDCRNKKTGDKDENMVFYHS